MIGMTPPPARAATPAAAPAPAAPAAPGTPATPAAPTGLARPLMDHPDIPKRSTPANAAPDAQPETPVVEAKEDVAAEPVVEEPVDPTLEEGDIDLDPEDTYFELDGKEVTLNELIETHRKYHTAQSRLEGANKKFNEAAQMRTNAIETVKHMATPHGFVDMCTRMGADPYAIAADIVMERARYEQMTPEQRQMHDDQARLREYQAREKQAQAHQAQQQAEAQMRAYTANVLQHMVTALDAVQVPADPDLRNDVVGRAGQIMSEDLGNGVETTPAQAIQEAWDEHRKRIKRLAPHVPEVKQLTAEERQAIAREEAKKAVKVAQATPAKPLPPRASDGKFEQKKPAVFDWSNPAGTRAQR
jgi:hypothetical protein